MGRLEQIEKRDAFTTMTTSRHQDAFTSEDREWLIARVKEAQPLLREAQKSVLQFGYPTQHGAIAAFLAKLEATDA